MARNYSIDDKEFQPSLYGYEPITASNSFSLFSGKYEINHSSILSALIQEAGRYCEIFASDLFIHWEAVLRAIDENAGKEFEKVFLFGFRQNGVDHANYVISNYNNNGESAKYSYRSLWRLAVFADGKTINMILTRVF